MHLIWELLLSAAYPKNLHPKAILGKEKKNRKAAAAAPQWPPKEQKQEEEEEQYVYVAKVIRC